MEPSLKAVFPDLNAAAYLRFRRCLSCGGTWQSVELPSSLVYDLLIKHHSEGAKLAQLQATLCNVKGRLLNLRMSELELSGALQRLRDGVDEAIQGASEIGNAIEATLAALD